MNINYLTWYTHTFCETQIHIRRLCTMNFKELTKQEMKVFKISDYQNLYELTDSQMAARVNLSLNRYQEIMRDCENITLEEVYKIARGLDISVSTLMDCLLENINPPMILSLYDASASSEKSSIPYCSSKSSDTTNLPLINTP